MIDQFDMHSMMMIQSWPHAANETLKFQNGEAFHNALKIFKEGGGICHQTKNFKEFREFVSRKAHVGETAHQEINKKLVRVNFIGENRTVVGILVGIVEG